MVTKKRVSSTKAKTSVEPQSKDKKQELTRESTSYLVDEVQKRKK